jgi:hypothetical protein
VAPGLQNQWTVERSFVGSTPIRFRHLEFTPQYINFKAVRRNVGNFSNPISNLRDEKLCTIVQKNQSLFLNSLSLRLSPTPAQFQFLNYPTVLSDEAAFHL